jgi:Tol biopolymer transport system component
MTSARPLPWIAALVALVPGVRAQQTLSRLELASVGPTNLVGDGPSEPSVEITPDARFVVFSSFAPTLVPGDTNGNGTFSIGKDVFIRDRALGTTERVNVGPGGVQADRNCAADAISADGRVVAFHTNASTLPPGGNSPLNDQLYVADRASGALELVSVKLGGGLSFGDSKAVPGALSADGRWIAFSSTAVLTSPPPPCSCSQVYRRDRLTGITEAVSVTPAGAMPVAESLEATITAVGRYVCFRSDAPDLVPNDGNARWTFDVFVRDMQTGTTQRVNLQHDGAEIPDTSGDPHISRDGRFVVFTTYWPNIVPFPVPLETHAYLRDLAAGTNELVSVGDQGQPAVDHSANLSVSGDGRYVVFDNWDGTLTADGDVSWFDVYRRERATGTTLRVSVPWNGGQANLHSRFASVADDGAVAFWAAAGNLVPADINGHQDILVRAWETGDVLTICDGDGLARRCPCDNWGATGNGCASSFNTLGAHLAGSGTPSVSADTLVLAASGMLDNHVTYVQGETVLANGYGNLFGDGLFCAGGHLIRLATVPNAGGASQVPGPGALPISVRGMVPAGGGVTRIYQVVFRDPAAFCSELTYSATNALSVLWGP